VIDDQSYLMLNDFSPSCRSGCLKSTVGTMQLERSRSVWAVSRVPGADLVLIGILKTPSVSSTRPRNGILTSQHLEGTLYFFITGL